MQFLHDLSAIFQRQIRHDGPRLLLVLALAYLALNLLTLDRVPLIDVDEAVEADAAWVLWHEGHSTPTMMGGHAHLGRLHLWSRGFVFALLGVGPHQDRLPSLIFGIAGLWFTYLLGMQLYGRAVARIASSLLAISTLYFNFSHYGRGDILVTLFYITATYCLWRATHGGPRWLFLLSGLLSALSMDAHLNGVALPAVTGVLLVMYFRQRALRERGVWMWIIGVTIGLSYYMFVHIILDRVNFLDQPSFLFSRRPPLLSLDWHAIATAWLDRYVWYYWTSNPIRIFELGGVLAALAGLIVSRDENDASDRFLLSILAAQFALVALLYTGHAEQYLLYYYPFLMLAVARTGVWMWKRASPNPSTWRKIAFLPALTLVGGLSLFYTGALFVKFGREMKSDYNDYQERLRATIPTGSVTVGNHNNWFGFHDQPYLSYAVLVSRSANQATGTLDPAKTRAYRAAARARQVEYFIADGMVLYELGNKRADISPQVVADTTLGDWCQVIATVEDPHYGGGWPGQEPPYKTIVYHCRP